MRSRVFNSELHKRWLFVNSEVGERYGVATGSRIDKIICLFGRISSLL